MKELQKVYRERDRWRLATVKYKAACDAQTPPLRVDLTDLQDLIGEIS
jgi:hypothetical protein